MGMVRRRTRRRTMMVAGGLAYERGQERQGQARPVPASRQYAEPPPPPPAPPAPAAGRASPTQPASSSVWRRCTSPGP